MKTSNPTINTVLADFYVSVVTKLPERQGQRWAQVLDELRYFLEREPAVPLTDEQAALRYFELQFNHVDAFARVMHARELVLSLPAFMQYAHEQGLADQALVLTVVLRLKNYLQERRLLDARDPLVEIAVEQLGRV